MHTGIAQTLTIGLIHRHRKLRTRRTDEARATPVANISVQRKLRNRQNLAAVIQNRTVHLAFIIFKNAQIDRLIHTIANIVLRIAVLNTAKHHKAFSDASDFSAVYLYAGLKNPLYDQSHVLFLSNLRLS